jgi:hypothetical protein
MLLHVPHEFTNPYLLAAGLFSRVTKWNSVIILSILALANWCFFATGLRALCDRLFKVKAAAVLALLMALCFWGPLAWNFSGFWHLKMIGDSAAFPSTFAGASTFWVWVLCLEYMRKKRFVILPIIAVAIGIIAVTHPHTVVTAVLGIVAFWYGLAPKGERVGSGFLFGACVVVGAALALVWPYYSLWTLTGHSGAEHESGNQWMYVNVVWAIGPVLLGVPIVLWRFKQSRRDPVALLFVAYRQVRAGKKHFLHRRCRASGHCRLVGASPASEAGRPTGRRRRKIAVRHDVPPGNLHDRVLHRGLRPIQARPVQ